MDALFHLIPETFKIVTEEVMRTIHKSDATSVAGVESNVIESIKEEIRKLFISNNFNFDSIAEQMKSSDRDDEKVKLFISIMEENKADIIYFMLLRHNSGYGDAVSDYNWFVKLVLGMSDLKILKYPLLQLGFSTLNSSGQQTQRMYDLSRESLSKLIAVIEKSLEIN